MCQASCCGFSHAAGRYGSFADQVQFESTGFERPTPIWFPQSVYVNRHPYFSEHSLRTGFLCGSYLLQFVGLAFGDNCPDLTGHFVGKCNSSYHLGLWVKFIMEPRFRTAHAQSIQNRNTIIAGLRLQLHGHDKGRFGSKSKSSAQLALELILEELEIEQAAESGNEDEPSQAEATKPPRTSRKRKPFPKNLKRVQMTIPHSEVCADCGGSFKVL